MSCGQRSQVALGLILAQNADLLVLDDFSMGLDPGYRRLFVEYLRDYAQSEEKTVFLTSHIIQDMEKLVDDCIIMDYGSILVQMPVGELLGTFRRYTFTPGADRHDPRRRRPLPPERRERARRTLFVRLPCDGTGRAGARGHCLQRPARRNAEPRRRFHRTDRKILNPNYDQSHILQRVDQNALLLSADAHWFLFGATAYALLRVQRV